MTASELQIFNFSGDPVRTTHARGQQVWVGKDVCDALGLSKYRDALAQLDEDERVSIPVDTLGGTQRMTAVTEGGVWALMLISRSPKVQPFKRWFTHEVLPALRQHGTYSVEPVAPRELSRLELIDMARDSEVGRLAAEERVQELEPSALAWDHLASTAAGDLSVNEAAKTLSRDPEVSIGETRLWRLLDEWRWTYRDHSGDRRPYQTHVDNGRLACRARSHHHPRTGELLIDAPQVRVTPKGLSDIRRRLVRGELRSVS